MFFFSLRILNFVDVFAFRFSVQNTSFKWNGIIFNNSKWQIKDGRSSCFFSSKWHHHEITDIVKDHLCVIQLRWFYQRFYYLDIFRFMSALKKIWRIRQISSTIWRHNDARLRYGVNKAMSRSWDGGFEVAGSKKAQSE